MSKITFVVEYGDSVAEDSAGGVAIELDDSKNLDSDGEVKSQFYPGDKVYFLVHLPDGLRIERVASTDGMVVARGQVAQSRQQDLLFVGEDPVSLSYQPAGSIAKNWQGKVGTGWAQDDTGITVAGGQPCLCKVSYSVAFLAYYLVPPALSLGEDETYTIIVVVYVEAA